MIRLDALEGVQRFGATVGAYRNIAWLLIVLVGAGVALFKSGVTQQTILLVNITLAVFSAGMLIAVVLLSRRATAPIYRWVSAEYTYRFDVDDLRMQTQIIKIRIRANRDNVDLFQNSYYWTGEGKNDIRVLSPGHKLVCETQARDSERRYYYIHLGTPLNRSDETWIHVEQDLFDTKAEFQPILAKKVSEPLDKLILKVLFPSDDAPRLITARQTVRPKGGAVHWRQVKKDSVEWSDQGTFTEASYSPPAPRVGRRYEIDWSPWEKYPKPDNLA